MRRSCFLVFLVGTALAMPVGFIGVAAAHTGPDPIGTPSDARNDIPSRPGQWVRLTYGASGGGPFVVPGGSPYGQLKNQFVSVPAACTNCAITDVIPNLIDETGATVNTGAGGLMLHHFVLINPGKPDLMCSPPQGQSGFGQRFFASGNERTHMHLPTPFGYENDSSNWALIYHLVNFNTTNKNVYVELKVRYRPKSEGISSTPAWLDIDGCGSGIGGSGDSDYSIPTSPSYTDYHDPDGAPLNTVPPAAAQPAGTYTADWKIPFNARLIAISGHSHDVDVTGPGSCVPAHCVGEGGGLAVNAELIGGTGAPTPPSDYFGPSLGPTELPTDIRGTTLCRSKAYYGTTFAGTEWNGHLDTMSQCGIFTSVPAGAQAQAYPSGGAFPSAGVTVTTGPSGSPQEQWIRLHSEYQNNTGSAQTDVMGIMMAWFVQVSQGPQYPRPGGATPLRVPLVPEFTQCTSPNSNHISPLNNPSCSPPSETSSVLTTSNLGRGTASARYDTVVGNTSTTADEANVNIAASASDVVCRAANAACPGGANSDYAGRVVLATTIRVTDRLNVPVDAGTVIDREFYVPFSCVATPASPAGGTCSVTTSADALVPNYISETRRTIMAVKGVTLKDAGPNGTGLTTATGCPETCGDGDEAVYLRQGVFTP